MGLGIYDIAANDVILGGIAIKDAIVSAEIAFEGNAFADEAGADGSVVRYATHENRATATIVLKGSSDENAKLSALHALDKGATNGAGVVPFLVRDNNGTTLIATDKAWIQGFATKTLAAAPGDVTWSIRLVLDSPLNVIIGGN